MKSLFSSIRKFLTVVLVCGSPVFLNAQSLTFSTSTGAMCAPGYTAAVQAVVTSSIPGTAYMSWYVLPQNCTTGYSVSINAMNFVAQCAGSYTIYANALATNTSISLGTFSQVINIASGPGPSVTSASGSWTACAGTAYTLNLSGASSYTTLAPGGATLTGASVVHIPASSGSYTILATGSTCTFASRSMTVIPVPSVSAVNTVACSGNSAMLFANGATSYTWSQGGNSSVATVTPNVSTCYTVTGSNPGCPGTSSAVACVSVTPQSTITVGTPGACMGSAITYTSSSSATWIAVGTSSWSAVGSSVSIPWGALGCFQLLAPNTCASMPGTICPVYNPLPTPMVNVSSFTVCAGGSVTLTATGANTYSWSNGLIVPQIVVTPNTFSTCISVIGTSTNGCSGGGGTCFQMLSGPSLTVAGSNTVCQGSSVTYTVSGGSNYVWSNGPITNTMNILPANNTVVTVSSTGANGCVGTYSFGLQVDTTCANVWPGDANSDGIVGATDVFEIGLGFNSTGSSRTSASNNYVSQHATTWAGTISNGKNLCHADCNGDGTINFNDTVAIFNNFGLTHAFKPSGTSADPEISLVAPAFVNAGAWNVADVVIGSSTLNVSQLYGASYELNFDINLIDDAYLVYTSSFLNASTQNVEFRKNFISNGKVVGVTVRTDQTDVSGNGKIAELHYKVKSGLAGGTQLDFSVGNAQKVDHNGGTAVLVPGTLTQFVATTVGLDKNNKSIQKSIYPNPASTEVTIMASSTEEGQYRMSDLTGRMVTSGTFNGETKVDVSLLNNGVYFLQIETAGGNNTLKVIVDHK